MDWRVYDQCQGPQSSRIIAAASESEAREAWLRLEKLTEETTDVEATPICPRCRSADEVWWVDAWRDWNCGACKDWFSTK